MRDAATLEAKYKRFINQICNTEIIYALKQEHGFAFLYANHFEDEEGEDAILLCFWSNEIYANLCKQAEWKNYQVQEIPLNTFLKNWCIGMKKDYYFAGIECDPNLYCSEKDPIQLALDIFEELILQGKLENFKEYYAIYKDFSA